MQPTVKIWWFPEQFKFGIKIVAPHSVNYNVVLESTLTVWSTLQITGGVDGQITSKCDGRRKPYRSGSVHGVVEQVARLAKICLVSGHRPDKISSEAGSAEVEGEGQGVQTIICWKLTVYLISMFQCMYSCENFRFYPGSMLYDAVLTTLPD